MHMNCGWYLRSGLKRCNGDNQNTGIIVAKCTCLCFVPLFYCSHVNHAFDSTISGFKLSENALDESHFDIWNYTFLPCKFLCFLCILHFRLFTLFLFPSFPPVANLDSANGDNYCHYKEQHSAWKIFHSFSFLTCNQSLEQHDEGGAAQYQLCISLTLFKRGEGGGQTHF